MTKKTIEIDGTAYHFNYTDTVWSATFTESRTRVKDMGQLEILLKQMEYFVPVEIKHEQDAYVFDYQVAKNTYGFFEIERMDRANKLRALRNVGNLRHMLNTRYTFFLHPDNIVFDINLMPKVIHRGAKGVLPPYNLSEETFFKQYQCLIIAMFSKKYSFDNLYAGSLKNARGSQFEKDIASATSIQGLMHLLEEAYGKEHQHIEKTMVSVPKRKFRTYKGLAVGFIIAAVLLAAPLAYFAFMKVPFQDDLLTANENFIKTDYAKVITILEDENPDKLPKTSKYELAYAYVQGEKLDDKKKENILRNVSLKSDEQYLLYWIYNGRGDFKKSLDIAKVLDEPELVTYAIIKQMEQVKNDPDLSGDAKSKKQANLEQELQKYTEQQKKAAEEAKTETKQKADKK